MSYTKHARQECGKGVGAAARLRLAAKSVNLLSVNRPPAARGRGGTRLSPNPICAAQLLRTAHRPAHAPECRDAGKTRAGVSVLGV